MHFCDRNSRFDKKKEVLPAVAEMEDPPKRERSDFGFGVGLLLLLVVGFRVFCFV